MSKYKLTKITTPQLLYTKADVMSDGTPLGLTVGEMYPIEQAYRDGVTTTIIIVNEHDKDHLFDIEDPWFVEHFAIVGDLDEMVAKND
jgi:hypothetical protein